MAIFNEALSIGHGATYPVPDQTDDGKVARLEHFLGRRGSTIVTGRTPSRSTRTVSMKSSMS